MQANQSLSGHCLLGLRPPVLVFFLGALLLAGLSPSSIGEDSPNVILILVDDMGWDVAALGHPHVKTPHLDRMVEEGRTFENYYVASPVCSPTRVSFMTGIHPSRLGIHDYLSSTLRQNWRRGMPNALDPAVVTVNDIAKRAGYLTGHFGKEHIDRDPAVTMKDYGVDVSRLYWANSADFRSYSSFYCVDEATEFIDQRGDKPFYINLWFFQMHRPVVASSAQKQVYEGELFPAEDFTGRMREYAEMMKESLEAAAGEEAVDGEEATDDEEATDGEEIMGSEERFLNYNGVMTTVDAAIGRLFAHLESEGLADKTLILVTSDNGPEDYRMQNNAIPGAGSQGRFRGRKRSLYEGGVRLPCIARWPDQIPAGTVDRTTVMSSLDWLPTVCALMGEELPPNIDGENMLGALKGQPVERARPLIWEFRAEALGPVNDAPRWATRAGHWKMLWESADVKEGSPERLELYDLQADPEERNDLAGTQPEVEEALLADIQSFEASLGGRAAVVTVHPVPELLPSSGESAHLRVEAEGTPAPTYRWYRDGVALEDGPRITGAGSHLLVLDQLTLEDTGEFYCQVMNANGGSITRSNSTRIYVQEAPTVTSNPSPRYVWEGGVATFSVAVRGSGPLSYQWYRGGIPLEDENGVSGAEESTLTLTGLNAPLDERGAAGYSCRIENLAGFAYSRTASLFVSREGEETFDSWIALYSEDEIPEGSYLTDRDGDGWTDFLEFAGVSDPTAFQRRPRFAVREDEGGLELSYDRWRGGTEMGFGSYETPSLSYDVEVWEQDQWVPLLELLMLDRREVNAEGSGERVYYRSNLPADRRSLLFRLRVTQK